MTNRKGLALRIALLGLLCQLASILPASRLTAAAKHDSLKAQTGGAVPESSSGLESQLEAILGAVRDRNLKQFNDLIDDLQLPESANWFAATFGEERGQGFAATSKGSWKDYEESVKDIFRYSGAKKHTRAFVREVSASASTPGGSLILAIVQSAKGPVALYTASAGRDRESDRLPGVYIYVQGFFRVVNWRTFCLLPNVKPMRIRISAEVAQARLVHQVNPVPPSEAFHERVRGTVMLHVVLDRDGNVAQLEPVSGPQQLFDAATTAVRQWRYEPMLLNGDPVEVDTTITIAFSLDGHP